MSFDDLAGEITAAWNARNEPDGLPNGRATGSPRSAHAV